MTTFKPGDKVSSPLLPADVWTVIAEKRLPASVTVRRQDGYVVHMPVDTLTLVAPPLPPEPPIGTVGWVGEAVVCRDQYGWSLATSRLSYGPWSSFADRFTPAVPRPTVDEMAEALYGSDVEGVTAAERASIIMCELGWEVPE